MFRCTILIRFESKHKICVLLRVSCCYINQAKFIYIFSEFWSKYNKQKGNSKYRYKTQLKT